MISIRPAVANDAQSIGAVFDAAVCDGWTYLGELARKPMFPPEEWDKLVIERRGGRTSRLLRAAADRAQPPSHGLRGPVTFDSAQPKAATAAGDYHTLAPGDSHRSPSYVTSPAPIAMRAGEDSGARIGCAFDHSWWTKATLHSTNSC